jgi:hypothetical protein
MLVSLAPLMVSSASAQDTIRFEPTVGHPTFAVREPVLRIKPGTVLISKTNFGAYYEEGGGTFPGEVGPFYVEGATRNDMLVVEIHRVRPNHRLAGSQIYSSFGGLATDNRVRLLNDPIPPRRYEWRLDGLRWRHGARKHSADYGLGISVATWTRRKCGRAPQSTCPSSTTVPISTSATVTHGRAKVK